MPVIKISNVKGQTLIETVIALAVVLILVSALLSLSVASVRSATLSRNKTAASQLAYQQSDLLRNLRDGTTNYNWVWANFISGFNGLNCSPESPPPTSTTPSCHVVGGAAPAFVSGPATSSVGGTTFTIYIKGPTATASLLSYTVYVTWTDSMGPHMESISSILTPWK